MNLLCDVSLPRRIALRCMVALSSTGFSLCIAAGPQLKPHRLKPVLLDRAGAALVSLAEMPVGNFHRVLVRNADWCFYPCGFTRVVPCGQWGLNSESGIRTLRAMFLYWMMK